MDHIEVMPLPEWFLEFYCQCPSMCNCEDSCVHLKELCDCDGSQHATAGE